MPREGPYSFHSSHFFLSILMICIIQAYNSCNASTNNNGLGSIPNSSSQLSNNISVLSDESNNVEQHVDQNIDQNIDQNMDIQYDDNSSTVAYETKKAKIIIEELKILYKKQILPIERKYHLNTFLLPKGGEIHESEFNANPLVLLIGQYSTGKVSLQYTSN